MPHRNVRRLRHSDFGLVPLGGRLRVFWLFAASFRCRSSSPSSPYSGHAPGPYPRRTPGRAGDPSHRDGHHIAPLSGLPGLGGRQYSRTGGDRGSGRGPTHGCHARHPQPGADRPRLLRIDRWLVIPGAPRSAGLVRIGTASRWKCPTRRSSSTRSAWDGVVEHQRRPAAGRAGGEDHSVTHREGQAVVAVGATIPGGWASNGVEPDTGRGRE